MTLDPDRVPSLGDAELVERARKGDGRAFEMLVRRNLPRAHGLAVSILKDEDQADDVCQEAFLAALKRLDQLRNPDRFQPWLLRITRNVALNQLKKNGRTVVVPLQSLEGFPGPDDPDSALREGRVREALRGAIAHLSGMPKRVFILHEIEGWDHEEISRELGISRGASRVHLHLARRTLRSKVGSSAWEEA